MNFRLFNHLVLVLVVIAGHYINDAAPGMQNRGVLLAKVTLRALFLIMKLE